MLFENCLKTGPEKVEMISVPKGFIQGSILVRTGPSGCQFWVRPGSIMTIRFGAKKFWPILHATHQESL